MPTIPENVERWTKHQWVTDGSEWSPGGSEAGTEVVWWRTLLPRIHSYVPSGTVLEIGPGYGRWTQYLKGYCNRLLLVDVTSACIEACRERFRDERHLEFIVNDGTSLDMIGDGVLDFVFSFDSLVHAEADVLEGYLLQLSRSLRSDGVAFIHHSNLGAFADPSTSEIARYVTRRNWRATTASACQVRDACRRAGLHCQSQELVNWVGRGQTADRHRLVGRRIPLTDCFSIVRRPGAAAGSATRVVVNPHFVDEWRQSAWMSKIYAAAPPAEQPTTTATSRAARRKVTTASTVLLRDGVSALTKLVTHRLGDALEFSRSFVKQSLVGEAVKRSEPFVRRIESSACPDCLGELEGGTCGACRVSWIVT